ncbi:Jacalin-related lectin 38 [Cardamine amara subsp. amara]|uniref:Jacalin-related lectin 38 n=1 Tax=Cardamine amara subsp. amara TaxID=228776 RepID=A0ABD1CA24_CARAN
MSQHQVGDRTVEVSVRVGGDEWDDGFFDNVKKIIVDFNYFGIVFIKIYYCNGNVVVAGAARGGDSIETRGFLVAEDDYIEAVEGTYTESYITSIAFRSHKGNKSGSLGFFEGKSFALGGGRGSKIIGFYGRSSHLQLTAFGVRL